MPIVPAAVIFDLGRGGDFSHRPTAEFGRPALDAARADDPDTGCVGAGTGAKCGGLKGGFGYAELSLGAGRGTIAAAVAVNAAGSAVDPATGRLWADRLAAGWPTRPRPSASALDRAQAAAVAPPLNTTIGVVLTDATLTKAQASKVAADRARRDWPGRSGRCTRCWTATRSSACPRRRRRPRPIRSSALGEFNGLLAAAADVFTDACLGRAPRGATRAQWPSYAALAPSVRH